MRKAFINISLTAFFLCFAAIPAVLSQDLGSTNGLFRPKPPAKKPAPKKKEAAKKTGTTRKSSSKATPASRSAAGKPKPAAPNTPTTEKTTETAAAPVVQVAGNRPRRLDEDIVITIPKPEPASPELFEKAIQDGNTARNRRFYAEAEMAYGRARTFNPQDSRAIYGLGNVYSDQQRWEEAEEAYRQALKIEPLNPMANIALSFVLTQPVAGTNLGERYNEAEVMARKAIELDPQNALGYDQLGVAMELRGLISEDTQSAYRKALSLDPTYALGYAHLGRLLRKNGLTTESSSAYREAIRLAVNVPTMILVADVMQTQQRYLDSEQLLREALRRDPRNPTGLYLLGRALTTRKSFDEAEEVLTESLAVSPKSFVSYTMLASMYMQSGDLVKAEATLVKSLSLVSENEKRRLSLDFEMIGDGFRVQKRFADAARLYRRAFILDGSREELKSKLSSAETGIA